MFAFAGLILAAALLIHAERTALSSRSGLEVTREFHWDSMLEGRSLRPRAPARPGSVNTVVRQRQLAASYGQLPLSFEANLDQTDPRVKFLSRGQGYALFLTRDEAVLSLRSGSAGNLLSFLRHDRESDSSGGSEPAATTLRMKLAGASPSARVEGMDKLPGVANYFIGNDPKKWRTNVPSYAKVKYSGIYPGVDLVYYGEQRQLEYDFVVAPGADPQQIALDIQGTRELHVDAQGDLVAQTGAGEIRLHKPVAYQWSSEKGPAHPQRDAGKHFIDARFKLRGRSRVKFVASNYDPSKPLIIDPVLTYATFLGGSGEDIGIGIAADSAGNAYVTGGTLSTNFPTTAGVAQPTFGGPSPHCGGSVANFLCGDAFVTKIDPTGTTILASTYLGGSDADVGFRIAIDNSGFIYVAGRTASANFPVTTGVFQQMFGGGLCGQSGGRPCPDGFITKLDPTLATLTYSSFIGGSGDDSVSGLAVDFAGNAFLAGQTESANFPTTTGSLSPNPIGGTCTAGTLSAPCPHAFVAEVNPSGTMLTYSTYLGGHGDDGALGIALDAADGAFVVGFTDSTDFPGITTSSPQPAFGGGTTAPAACQSSICGDGFLAELNPAGSMLIYATYIGGTGDDAATNVVVDFAGNAYVTGDTDSSNFFTTAGAPQRTFGGGSTSCTGRLVTCGDAFAVKVDPTGTAFLYSTYLGGNGDDGSFFSSAIDIGGDLYVGGTTNSANFPTVSSIQATFGGGSPACNPSQELCGDGFVTEINPSGTAFLFSTYLGGSGDDGVAGLVLDAQQNILLTGFTASPNFPVTPGAAQTKCGSDGNCNALSDAFVAKMGLPVFRGPYALGEVFAADGVGLVDVFKPDGTFLGVLDTHQNLSAGMAFDKTGNLYVTNFCPSQTVSKFDANANLLGTFGSGFSSFQNCPESILFDQMGNAFVGAASFNFVSPPPMPLPLDPIFEFNSAGNPVMTFQAAAEDRGTDWIELLADQHTMLYTSEGHLVKSFNIQSNTQNPDFATGLLGAAAFALRQLPSGDVLVADSDRVVQLNSTGSVIQTYTTNPPSVSIFALNLDPDGTTFWTADLNTGTIFHFNIQSGTQLISFNTMSSIAAGLAIFGEKAPGTNNLTVTKAGTGTGTVTSSPAGINCGTVCTAPFTSGSNVMLTATPDPGSTFVGFTGACTGTSPCSVTMNGDQAVTATFALANFALTVTEAGTGSGTVTSNPAGINCPTACSANFPSGTMVTLSAAAATGSTFAGWSGACTNATGTCTVTMNQAQNVTATFNTQQFTLTVTDAGTGSGTVTSQAGLSPAINCASGSTAGCSANYNSGTMVTLTAAAATGSTFAGWSGACEGTGTCTVTMNSNQAVTATFNTSASNFTLTVTEAGNGSGTVTSSPPGINCPTTCSANFASGTMVTLTATAGENSTFIGWSGACSGTGTCSVTVNSNQAVTATFNLNGTVNFTLSTGSGSGTSATVQPGDTAVFLFNLSSVNGFTGKVNLSCASQQPTITCSIVPSMVNLGPGITATMITVNTFCSWLGPRFGPLDKTPGPWLPSLGVLMALAMLVAISGIRRQKLRLVSPLAALALFAISFAGCASVPHGPSGATPPGTYNLVITASAPGSAPQSITLTLKVL